MGKKYILITLRSQETAVNLRPVETAKLKYVGTFLALKY